MTTKQDELIEQLTDLLVNVIAKGTVSLTLANGATLSAEYTKPKEKANGVS